MDTYQLFVQRLLYNISLFLRLAWR